MPHLGREPLLSEDELLGFRSQIPYGRDDRERVGGRPSRRRVQGSLQISLSHRRDARCFSEGTAAADEVVDGRHQRHVFVRMSPGNAWNLVVRARRRLGDRHQSLPQSLFARRSRRSGARRGLHRPNLAATGNDRRGRRRHRGFRCDRLGVGRPVGLAQGLDALLTERALRQTSSRVSEAVGSRRARRLKGDKR